MYDFTNKYICLVLTCDKPIYNENRLKNKDIYSQIHNAGFEIVFLYANNTNTHAHIIKNENGYYNLTVPTEETYLNLSIKMHMAYFFFATQDIKGILKIDDDVYHIDENCLDLHYFKTDYLGASSGDIKQYFIDNNVYINDYYNNVLFASPQLYFGGPFYWVSKKSIQYIISFSIDLKLINAEDIYVGLCLLDKNDIKKYNTEWNIKGYVLWTESNAIHSEKYTVYPETISTELCKIMGNNNSDKGNANKLIRSHNYTPYYYELFKDRRYDTLRIFEVGIGTNNINIESNMGINGRPGASLYGWAEFFPNSFIYGGDIDRDILFEDTRIKTYYCDQTKPDIICNMWKHPDLQDNFDIIIDDGLHFPYANRCLFENSIHKLNDGGIYIIEDVQDIYLKNFNDIVNEWNTIYSSYTFKIVKIQTSHGYGDNNLIVINK